MIWQQPSGREYSPKGGFDLKGLMDTWLLARQLKSQRMQQDRDKALLQQLMSGQDILPSGLQGGLETQVPAGTMTETGAIGQQPQGMLGKIMSGIGEFMTGGKVSPESLPMGDLQRAMAEAQIKARFEPPRKWEPTTKEEAFEFEREKAGIKKTQTEKFREDLKKARIGEITWDELKAKYPEPSKQTQIEQVRKSTLPQLKRSPQFRMGRGLVAKFSPNIANINEKTLKVIEQIRTEEDLQELLERRDEARIKGIDVNAILEYFGQRK